MQHIPRRSIIFQAIILPLFFAGCLSTGCTPELPEHSIPQRIYLLPEEHTLVISLNDVNLELVGHEEPNLTLSGLSSDTNVEIVLLRLEAEGTTQLMFNEDGGPKSAHTQVTILIPHGSQVEVLQESGFIFAHDFNGNLSIETISAPIQLDQIHGRVHAISRRGTIQVSNSQGTIDVLAESDEIRLTDLHGQITGTNIMGAITYNGKISKDDSAQLETDHGAVTVQLEEGSGAKIEITSAGGRIVCTLPGMSGMFGSCEGIFGDGSGAIAIRTVSGPVRIDQVR